MFYSGYHPDAFSEPCKGVVAQREIKASVHRANNRFLRFGKVWCSDDFSRQLCCFAHIGRIIDQCLGRLLCTFSSAEPVTVVGATLVGATLVVAQCLVPALGTITRTLLFINKD